MYLAVHSTDGAETTIYLILEHLGILPGKNYKRSCIKLDRDTIRHSAAERKSSEQAKKNRKVLVMQ